MAQPARKAPLEQETPPVDPGAVVHAYRLERAKRRARYRHEREQRLARLRFLIALTILLTALALLGLTIWNEIERLFGF